MMNQTYSVTGMHCDACKDKIEKAIREVPHVESVDVDLNENKIIIQSSSPLSFTTLNKSLEKYRGVYSISEFKKSILPQTFHKYKPIIVIYLLLIVFTTLLASLRNSFHPMSLMADFMGGFFIIFSFFKIINPKNFAPTYARYDVISNKVLAWAYIYPFVEFLLGIGFLSRFELNTLSLLTLVIMGIGSIGIIKALRGKKVIECACLGGFFKLPMSKVTLFEDISMVVMSILMLL